MMLAFASTTTTPALDDFASAWATIGAYRATLTMHETAGSNVEDRTYAYTFTKPASATIAITRGPGRGGRVAWTGGDTVSGSPPGLFSAIKVHLSIHDRRATTLRGDTVVMASFGWLLDHLRTTRGTLTQTSAAAEDGTPSTQLTLLVADSKADDGITKEIVLLSSGTKLPVRVERYIGTMLVKEVRYTNVTITEASGPSPKPAPSPS